MVSKNKNSNRIKILVVTGILLLVACIVYIFWISNNDKEIPAPTDTDSVNYNPPTESDSRDVQRRKEEIVKEDQLEQNNSSNKKQVTPVLTETSKTRVFGFVGDVVEATGACVFTFNNGTVVVKKNPGVPDVSKTNCATTPPSGSGWSVILSYTSPTASGKSQESKIE